MLKSLEKKLDREYSKAYLTVKEKLDKYLKRFEEADKKKLAQLKANEITHADYVKWRTDQMLNTQNFRDLRDVLSQDLVNTNKIAAGMINDHTIDVYALNRNYGSFEVCKGTGLDLSFSLYDHKTVENLMKGKRKIIPKVDPKTPKDLRWNRTKITSAISQGVLSGDSIPDIAKRLRSVTNMDKSASIRNARTYTTAAENAGRVDSYEEAEDMGIEMEQEWMALIDERTRPSHVAMDGERVPVGEKFSNELRYPADPEGDPEETYNCRCTLIAVVKDHAIPKSGHYEKLAADDTYEDWKARGVAKNEENKRRKAMRNHDDDDDDDWED